MLWITNSCLWATLRIFLRFLYLLCWRCPTTIRANWYLLLHLALSDHFLFQSINKWLEENECKCDGETIGMALQSSPFVNNYPSSTATPSVSMENNDAYNRVSNMDNMQTCWVAEKLWVALKGTGKVQICLLMLALWAIKREGVIFINHNTNSTVEWPHPIYVAVRRLTGTPFWGKDNSLAVVSVVNDRHSHQCASSLKLFIFLIFL